MIKIKKLINKYKLSRILKIYKVVKYEFSKYS